MQELKSYTATLNFLFMKKNWCLKHDFVHFNFTFILLVCQCD